MSTIHQPHDKFIKDSLSNKPVAREFFDHLLPDKIRELVDLNHLHLENTSFLDDEMKASACDLLFTTKFDGQPGYLYLLVENQIKPDPIMALRLWEYMLRAWRKHHKEHSNEPLPVIYPMLFYAGDKPYNEPMDLINMFAESDQAFARNILYNPFQLVDISQSSESDFEQYQRLDYLITAIKCYRDFEAYGSKFARLVLKMLGLDEFEYNATGLTYVGDGVKVLSPEELMLRLEQALTTDERQVMESFSEHFMKKGEERAAPKYRQEGRQEMVISMLNNGIDINLVVKSSGLSRETIEELYAKHKRNNDH